MRPATRAAASPSSRSRAPSPSRSSPPGRSATGRTFGTPFPGQALSNALSVDGSDIFAWQNPPTLSRYLALGPARLAELRVEGIAHNLFSVLLLPGLPTGLIGLFGLPALARVAAARPTLIVAAVTFAATSLLFPVSTTWGTFLHAAGPAHVLLIVGSLVVLDRLIVEGEELFVQFVPQLAAFA